MTTAIRRMPLSAIVAGIIAVLSTMRLARRYLISGRVQGVGFRYFTRAQATREGVQGWVRNLPDGRVEISAEADAAAMARFDRELRQGPGAGRIDRVDVVEAEPGTEPGLPEFIVR